MDPSDREKELRERFRRFKRNAVLAGVSPVFVPNEANPENESDLLHKPGDNSAYGQFLSEHDEKIQAGNIAHSRAM
jgi:hypothetical protein